ncbi:hypothetical protein ACEWY4_015186 [Coilia grayii]|uniref:Securin n=1 Tax=Coilia grayii TaxID=363190 RepID=A0ABD1JMG9_9TELE
MNTLMFPDRENVGLRLPAGKERQRLKSAPEFSTGKAFKAPLTPLAPCKPVLGPSTPLFGPCTPLQQRLALGSLKKVTQIQNVPPRREAVKPRCKEKETLKPVHDGEPDIERMLPYSPHEFERYGDADGVVYLSHLPLFGKARLPWKHQLPEIDDIILKPCDPLPPPLTECGTELDDFLLTLDELMVTLPSPLEDPPTP